MRREATGQNVESMVDFERVYEFSDEASGLETSVERGLGEEAVSKPKAPAAYCRTWRTSAGAPTA